MQSINYERTGQYLKEALRILKEHNCEYPSSELIKELGLRLTLNDYEKSLNDSGQYRWLTKFRFYSIGLVKGGWIEKTGRTWKLTDLAKDFESLSPEEIYSFTSNSYDKWNSNRNGLEEVLQIEKENIDEPEILMQVKPDDISFQSLIAEVSSCKIQIPPFQRSFVWRPSDIKYLLDSIYRGYPIGSFIFWKTSRKLPRKRNIGNLILNCNNISEGTEIKYVLDGQQRITSLYAAVKGSTIDEERFRFLFDLKTKKFIVSQMGEETNENLLQKDIENFHISIETVITNSLAAYRQICRQYGANEEYAKTLDTLFERFISYKFSIIEVIDQVVIEDEERSEGVRQVVEMFTRINNTGRKLTVVAKMVARCWGEGFDLRESLDLFFEENKGLESIREETLLQAASVILNFKKARSRDILEKTNIRKLEEEWNDIMRSFLLAVEFVTSKMKIRKLEYLPFDAVLVPLTYLFQKKHALDHNQTQLIEQWFWRVCLSNRYDSTVEARIEEDCEAFDELLSGNQPTFNYLIDWDTLKTRLIEQPYNLRNAFVKTVLSLYSYAEPKNLTDGRDVPLDRVFSGYYKHNLHHIFPQAYLRNNEPEQKDLFNSIVNIMFIPAIVNNGISDKPPSTYFPELQNKNTDFKNVLQHHYIPSLENSNLLNDKFLSFLEYRADQIFQAFRVRTGIGSSSEEFFDTDPARPIDILEMRIRTFIHEVLRKQPNQPYWKNHIPSDIKEMVSKKIQDNMKRHPYALEAYDQDEVKMKFLEVMDYSKIILSNWELFESYFGSKNEVEKHFLALKNYRNPIKHGRDLNEVDKKNGEASVLWLESVLK